MSELFDDETGARQMESGGAPVWKREQVTRDRWREVADAQYEAIDHALNYPLPDHVHANMRRAQEAYRYAREWK